MRTASWWSAGYYADPDSGRSALGVCRRRAARGHRLRTTPRSAVAPGRSRCLATSGGYLQVDAHAGYEAICATGRVVEVGCWAHARRYFREAKATDAPRALTALGFIQALYRGEAEAKEFGRRRAGKSNPGRCLSAS